MGGGVAKRGKGARRKNILKHLPDIWLWCEESNLRLSFIQFPGVCNIRADQLSRAGNKIKIWNGHLIQTFFMKFKR